MSETSQPSAYPPSLDVVQQWFQAVITHPDGVRLGVRSPQAHRLIRLQRHDLEQIVTRSSSMTAQERLEVYANAYYARLIECLGETFPVLKHAVGEEAFGAFAFEYLQAHPSRSYTLDHLADAFPSFLATTRPAREGQAPDWADFLVDLAELELAIVKVFDGPGIEGRAVLLPDQIESLDSASWGRARLAPVPCLHVLRFRFPLNDYYTAVRRSDHAKVVPPPAPAAQHLAVTRRDYVVRRFEIGPIEFLLLQALQAGQTVADALATAASASDASDDELAADIRTWFANWTRWQLLDSLRGD